MDSDFLKSREDLFTKQASFSRIHFPLVCVVEDNVAEENLYVVHLLPLKFVTLKLCFHKKLC